MASLGAVVHQCTSGSPDSLSWAEMQTLVPRVAHHQAVLERDPLKIIQIKGRLNAQ